MNLAQLELKRLRELLSGTKKARHLVHAMRTPLARFVRFERAALQSFNRPLAKLERMRLTGIEPIEPSEHRELVAHLQSLVELLAQNEAKITTRIERLRKAKKLTAPTPPIEERIASRRKAKLRDRAEVASLRKADASWVRALRTRIDAWLATSPAEDIRGPLMCMHRSGVNDPLERERLRLAGHPEWAMELLDMAKEQAEETLRRGRERRK